MYSDKVVVFVQDRLYSGKSGCIRAEVVVFVQKGCIRVEWLYSGKVVVFGKKWFYSGKKSCIQAKWL